MLDSLIRHTNKIIIIIFQLQYNENLLSSVFELRCLAAIEMLFICFIGSAHCWIAEVFVLFVSVRFHFEICLAFWGAEGLVDYGIFMRRIMWRMSK